MISIDDIVRGLEAYPELKIRHDGDPADTAAGLAPFLIRYFTKLSFVAGNRFFAEKFRQYNIPSYDTSYDRDAVLDGIPAKYTETYNV